MEKITGSHSLSKSTDIVKQNIEALKELFPTIVKEGKVDIDELKALLGEELETGEEYYRFTWAGKNQARQEANKPSTGTLRPVKEESKNWDITQNIFIEGDNLEVLKLLQKSYASKIKLIYIDPPYNTGKDFVYKDNYADNLGNYLAITEQTDEEGKKLSTNTESDGRFHSNWLNMIYPRLKLARNLLREDGVVFISIDDHEHANLKKVADEIFGEENFVSNIIWEKKFAPQNDAKWFSDNHDFVICYARNKELFYPNKRERTEEDLARFSNPDNDERGVWSSSDMTVKSYSEAYDYEILTPSGRIVKPTNGRSWSMPKNKYEILLSENRIWFGKDGSNVPRIKTFASELQEGIVPLTIWPFKQVGHNQEAKQELKKLFDDKSYFDSPKPVRLIKQIIRLSTNQDDWVLDFFAGSGTTAHAVFECNFEDDGSRKFICVQLPEYIGSESIVSKAGYTTIADITKDRIRRAGEMLGIANNEDSNLKDLNIDTGFRVFKLDSSNINAWDGNIQNFEQNLLSAAENIKSDRTEEDILYEILIKSGLDLVQPIEEKVIGEKKVFNIGNGALFICLANELTTDIAQGIGKWKEELEPATCRVIFKDTSFNDVGKTNSIQILKRYGINEVNTI